MIKFGVQGYTTFLIFKFRLLQPLFLFSLPTPSGLAVSPAIDMFLHPDSVLEDIL
jgi:hypothetical protein